MNDGVKERFVTLSLEELQTIISEAATKAATIACDNMERKHASRMKIERDKRLHNTNLLLKEYRTLKAGCRNAIFTKNEKVKVDDVIEEIMEAKNDAVVVESIKRSAERTEIILDHIDNALEIFRMSCAKGGEKEKRSYKVIKGLYINKEEKSIKELAKEFEVSEVTIHGDIKSAKEKLSVLFFCIDGLRFYQ